MNVISCLTDTHDPAMVLLAAVLCAFGSYATAGLVARTRRAARSSRGLWLFLAGLAVGATTWCTHFVAMLAYDPGVPFAFDPSLTAASLVVAVVGSASGIWLATRAGDLRHRLVGGAVVGLSVAAMHYLGMAAFRPDGVVDWSPVGIAASVTAAVAFGGPALAVAAGGGDRRLAAALLAGAIVSLHFTGMASVSVSPLAGASEFVPDDLRLIGAAIAAVGFLVMAAAMAASALETRSEERSLEEMRQLALRDALTGLPNRVRFSEIAGEALSAGGVAAIVGIDLDHFKEVNDLKGHAAGDVVLAELASRMSALLGEGETLARLGGDEFAALKVGADAESAFRFSERLRGAILPPVELPGGVASGLDASFGIALNPADGSRVEELLRKADLAMYRAKSTPGVNACLYDGGMDEVVRGRMALVNDLRLACERKEFELHYQVQMEIDGGAVTGFEALLRWRHPTRGLVPPCEFIPLAEETGLILPIGEWALRTACREAASWDNGARVAVNLSVVQFSHPDLPGLVRSALDAAGLPASRLEIELTESVLMNEPARNLAILGEIRKMGVAVAMDDFGTGYSSLSTLRSFRFDKIKLDRSFMAELDTNEEARAIIRAVLTLGASLRVPVLAEGVETAEQLDFLVREGCSEAQGYLLGRPARDGASRPVAPVAVSKAA